MITMRLCTILRGGYISLLSFLHFFPIQMNVEIIITPGVKRRKKELKQFNALFRLADRYSLSLYSRRKIIQWLEEEPAKEGDFKGLAEQMMRLMNLFPVSHERFVRVYSAELIEEDYRETVRSN